MELPLTEMGNTQGEAVLHMLTLTFLSVTQEDIFKPGIWERGLSCRGHIYMLSSWDNVIEAMGLGVITMETRLDREERRAKTLGHPSMKKLGRGRATCKGDRKGF